ncbi:MAG: hypothetical protein C9356_17975 [Oleiphilus sp.]|nr:MAG: hypothetical protein C9356_17975 [Oleiphilus sp.]
MPRTKIWILACGIIIMQSAFSSAHASVNSQNVISGFAKWNASRVEKIVLENALLKVAENNYVNKYFPSTAEVVRIQYDIGSTGLGALVKLAVEKDLNRFEAAIYQCIPHNINRWVVSEDLLELTRKPKALYRHLKAVITSNDSNTGISMIDFMNSVCPDLKEAQYGDFRTEIKFPSRSEFKQILSRQIALVKVFGAEQFQALRMRFEQARPEDFFNQADVQSLLSKSALLSQVFNSQTFKDLLTANQNAQQPLMLKEFLQHRNLAKLVKARLDEVNPDIDETTEQSGALPNTLEGFLNVPYLLSVYDKIALVRTQIQAFNSIRNSSDEENENVPYVVRAHTLLKVIDRYSDINERDFSGFHLVRKYSMFFASIADASNNQNGAEAVAGVLNDFVDEQGAYRSKRTNDAYAVRYTPDRSEDTHRWQRSCNVALCEDMLFVSSYFGLAFSRERTTGPIKGSYGYDYRPFGPVGIELKLLKLRKGSLLINYSPIDIGTYINNELQETSYEAKLDHIKSPSLFFSYTFNAYPAAILVGYQKDITLAEHEDEKMESMFISLAFDLPIFTLY